MNEQDDPYKILGVDRNADLSQIKTAYRKLALKHHPDKVAVEQRQAATIQFAKISNAYELLSDPQQRQDYDAGKMSSGAGTAAAPQRERYPQQQQDFPGFAGDPFASMFGSHFQRHFNQHQQHFHDPFSVFENFFREEFGGGFENDNNNYNSNRGSTFDNDPFFASHSSFFGRNDPFFGGLGGGPFGRMGMGGGFGRDPFTDMFSSMRRMEEQMQMQQQQMSRGRLSNNPNGTFYFSSSSSTSHAPSSSGESVMTQTTTKIINGRQQTVTERIVRKADGTVERHVVNRQGDDEVEAGLTIEEDVNSRRAARASLPNSSTSQQQQQQPPPHVLQRRNHRHGDPASSTEQTARSPPTSRRRVFPWRDSHKDSNNNNNNNNQQRKSSKSDRHASPKQSRQPDVIRRQIPVEESNPGQLPQQLPTRKRRNSNHHSSSAK